MSGSGCITLAVLLVGGAFCWFSLAGEPRTGYGADHADYSAETVRSMHLQVAQRLRDEGLGAAADWHERMANHDVRSEVQVGQDVTEEANDADGVADAAHSGGVRTAEADNGGIERGNAE